MLLVNGLAVGWRPSVANGPPMDGGPALARAAGQKRSEDNPGLASVVGLQSATRRSPDIQAQQTAKLDLSIQSLSNYSRPSEGI